MLRNRRITLEGNTVTGYDMFGKPTVIDLAERAKLTELSSHRGVRCYELSQRDRLIKLDSTIDGFDQLVEILRQKAG